MNVETYIFIGVILLYAIQCCLFIYGVSKARYPKSVLHEPTVSIVLAARNEETNILECLASLSRLEYPREKLEIIIVDDNSTDATPAIVGEWAKKNPNSRLLTARQGTNRLRGKANAIAQGIDVASGEIVMMTDADCAVPGTWVRATVASYADDTGVVAGLTLLRPEGWFAGMQSLDWAYTLAVASATMALRNPLSCIGNNFSFRRKAYDEVGGYRGIDFSVTEDFALFKAITRTGRWGYRYPLQKDSLVFSGACSNMMDLYRQKRRWGVGGKDMPFRGIIIMVVAFAAHFFIVASPLLSLAPTALVAGLLVKFSLDFVLVLAPLKRSGQVAQLKYFLFFEIYYMVYVLILPFAVFLGGRVVWKGRSY